MRMGIPRAITTDPGSEFRNKLNEELNRVLEIKHQLTTAYHPQVTLKFVLIIVYFIQSMFM